MTWTQFARTLILSLTALAAALFAGLLDVAPVLAEATPTVLVQFDAGTSIDARNAVVAAMGGELVAWMPQIQVAEVRLSGTDGVAVAAVTVPGDAGVRFAELDAEVSGAYLPSDPAFANADMVYGLAQIDAPGAWDYTRGSADVVVAVVDSGIKADHPEFAGRLTAGYDIVGGDEQADDDTGHGTHIAGIIAAAMDNGQGATGVCPGCRLMPVKVLGEDNLGTWSDLAQGILYAVDHGADVVNLSLGGSVASKTLAAAVGYAQAHDVLVVAAAGNYGDDLPYYPAALDGVVGVGATTAQDTRWQNSNVGAAVDVVAPGDLIFSAYPTLDNIFGGYMYLSGTSMATPHVSGLAGLALSLDSSLTAVELAEVLAQGADDLGAPGRDAEFGAGRINAAKTLTLVANALNAAAGDRPQGHTQPYAIFLPVLTH
jgi:subtilisin family serine protease